MRTGMLVLAVIALSLLCGCSAFQKSLPAPCGATDYIACPAGTKINDVPLPTDEDKTYTIVTPKVGFWISQECDERIGR